MKSAFIPIDDLPLLREIWDSWVTFEYESRLLEAQSGKKILVPLGGRNVPSYPGEMSYNGNVDALVIKVDPICLDPVEMKLIYGNTPAERKYKETAIANRTSRLPFLKEWITKHDAAVYAAGLFVAYPGATITPHRGISPNYIRIHVCIQESPAARFHTEFDPPMQWEYRKAFGFLDYHVLHWVTFDGLPSDPRRIVFYMDVDINYYDMYYPGKRNIQFI